ncbi:unnamed protein product [Larinioides sclopetarius]|uniref:P-loop containing nucleoside triphosphate hydrolase protein n=1 Tax=Larinioides sclopetarius TaxID=280406 RepID=A0AAV2BEC8_9ARAC
MGEKWIGNYGLLFEKALEEGSSRSDIVLVGSANSGKTELIQNFFSPRPPFITVSPRSHDKYLVNLTSHHAFELIIIDAKRAEFVMTTEFTEKTVFLFCYDRDNEESFNELEATWIPVFLQRGMQNMYYLSVGIEHDPVTNPEVDAEARQRERFNLRERAQRLIEQYGGRPLECSLSERASVLNVFQTALDTMHPRTSYN